jgi:hypothetical protein
MTSNKNVFRQLVAEWKAYRAPSNTVRLMTRHPAYQAIIELGGAAVPWLLEELAAEPDHWFAALRAIAGGNPVKSADSGDLHRMAGSWIEWGRLNGHLSS